jgi:hypothetical protein
MEMTVRPPAVAGSFYRGTEDRLRNAVREMLGAARPVEPGISPRIVIVPHAGHIYSGPIAAVAYRLLGRELPTRIGLIGPSHFVSFEGLAAPAHGAMATPLGTIPVDSVVGQLVDGALAHRSEPAHLREHSLEVQLPFLQVVLDDFTVAPLLTGDEDPGPAARAVSTMLDAGLFIVVSSDLSHYHDHETARRLDRVTAQIIVDLRETELDRFSACGRTAVRGALRVASDRGWGCELLDLRTSGDTAGSLDRVVGYGAFALGPA